MTDHFFGSSSDGGPTKSTTQILQSHRTPIVVTYHAKQASGTQTTKGLPQFAVGQLRVGELSRLQRTMLPSRQRPASNPPITPWLRRNTTKHLFFDRNSTIRRYQCTERCATIIGIYYFDHKTLRTTPRKAVGHQREEGEGRCSWQEKSRAPSNTA